MPAPTQADNRPDRLVTKVDPATQRGHDAA